MLLSYTCVDRRNFRIFLVVVAALMTFIIQFLFRKAQSFNVGAGLGSNLCLNWDSFVERAFEGESDFRNIFSPTPTPSRVVRPDFRVPVLLRYLSRIETLSREGMLTQKFKDRFIVKAIWAGLVFSFFVGHFISLGNLEPKPRWRFRVPRKLQRKWEGIMTLPSISKGEYPRKFNMNRDGPK